MIRVEVDAFSGRPNPSWSLTSQEGDELRRRLRTLPRGPAVAAVPEHLGYRGLAVTGPAADLGGYDHLVIYHGVVFARDAHGLHQFADHGRELERWLFQTGRDRIDAALFSLLLQDVAPG